MVRAMLPLLRVQVRDDPEKRLNEPYGDRLELETSVWTYV